MGSTDGNKKVKKSVDLMTNDELIDADNAGKKWLNAHEQVSGTNKNAIGEMYDAQSYDLGLARIEEIEGEMQRRKL